MGLMKNGLLGGAALALVTMGLVFTPQGKANESEEHMEMAMCVREAAMEFQNKMQHCDAYSKHDDRQSCKEKAREKFAKEREKCQMMRDTKGGHK